ncbi:MAG: hypothetical protein ACREAW_08035, partial [Nitrososphaera sp.]
MERLQTSPKDVILDKQKLVITKFETSDKEIVSYFQDIEPSSRRERFEYVLRTGVIALKTVGITERLDY